MFAQIQALLNNLRSFLNEPRIRLYSMAVKCIGLQLSSPNNIALGCVDSLNELHRRVFGKKIVEASSTIKLKFALDNDRSFVQVYTPAPCDIVLSVTGTGNGKLSNGHTGIVLTDRKIASNSSVNGRWTQNYTIDTWVARYSSYGQMATVFYRKLT